MRFWTKEYSLSFVHAQTYDELASIHVDDFISLPFEVSHKESNR